MHVIRFNMFVSTKYVGSDVTDIGYIEIDGTETKGEIENMIEDYTRDWVFDNIEWGFNLDEAPE